MQYIKLDEISSEIGLSPDTIRMKCYSLGIDTKKIGETEKAQLIEACSESISRKAESKEFEEVLKSIKVSAKYRLSEADGSKLPIMLELAMKDFDDNQKSIAQCQEVIDQVGTIIKTSHNGTISSNPAVKTKTELLKAQSTLRKDIKELEAAINASMNLEDDESPFGEE